MSSFINVIIKADQGLFLSINRQQRAGLYKFFAFITNFGGVWFQTGLALAMLLFPSNRALGVKLAYTQIVVTLVVHIIKRSIARVRPFNALESICPHKFEKDYSFPSGHTAATFSAALVLSTFVPVLQMVWFGAAVVVAFSRIYLGVHYPSDVLAGGMIGVGITGLLLI